MIGRRDIELLSYETVCTTVAGRAAVFYCIALELCAQWTGWRVHEMAGCVCMLDEHFLIDLNTLAPHTSVLRRHPLLSHLHTCGVKENVFHM